MKRISRTKRPTKVLLAALSITAALAIAAVAGCTSTGAVASVPADHYVDGNTANAINYDHRNCTSCHNGLDETFTAVAKGDLLAAHQQAWQDYQAGTLDGDGKQIVDSNREAMEKFFGKDANGQDCNQCHATGIDENGTIVAEDISTREWCLTCHDYDSVLESTANWGGDERVNVHKSHLGQIDCENCHLTHGEQDQMYCNDCHYWGMPEDSDWTNSPEIYDSTKR